MNEKDLQLNHQVLERVKAIYYMRTVVRPLALKAGLLLCFIVALCFLVSVPHVISNMIEAGEFASYGNYLVQAFVHTEVSVRFAIVVSVILFALVIGDLLKTARAVNFFRLLNL